MLVEKGIDFCDSIVVRASVEELCPNLQEKTRAQTEECVTGGGKGYSRLTATQTPALTARVFLQSVAVAE